MKVKIKIKSNYNIFIRHEKIFEYTTNQMSAAEREKLFTGVRQTLE